MSSGVCGAEDECSFPLEAADSPTHEDVREAIALLLLAIFVT
jgi:hypothetical protein